VPDVQEDSAIFAVSQDPDPARSLDHEQQSLAAGRAVDVERLVEVTDSLELCSPLVLGAG